MPHLVHEMQFMRRGRGTREMVLDMVLRFSRRNGGGRIYEITGFAFGNRGRKRAILTNPEIGSYELGFTDILLCRKETKELLEKIEDVSGSFSVFP